ncbi:SPOR domain-containing protein [Chitinolyticbacter meiyuanensis]|uniref:SPOR domain-containing protein n=1 Tax=Chitinolyticbacter meiyuanensis TaxID=682798 RepID=UPI0011E5E888|nr:SPOR domain-containing protein [Chitinolyticbacter meiyuanensis]
MRDNVSEELLQLRKRARRRLVGAIALVLFALVVLWTVMDATPPQNLIAASEPVVIEASAPSVAAPAPLPSTAPQAKTASEALAALPGRLTNAQTGHSSEPQGQPVVTEVLAPTATPRPAVTPVPTPKPTPKPAAKPTRDPKRILEGFDDAEAKSQQPAAGKVYVQIGAYGDAGKAADIVGKLKAAGLAAYSEEIKVKGVALTRVRVGPLAEAQAQKARDKAASLGYAPQLVSK